MLYIGDMALLEENEYREFVRKMIKLGNAMDGEIPSTPGDWYVIEIRRISNLDASKPVSECLPDE